MPAPVFTPRRLSFGAYEADLQSGELRKHGVRIRLQSQPFQLLAMLLERPGELITREEISQKLWSADTFVDFDHSLGTAINKIREVLNDSAVEPRFIETLPRRGYRFIAPVTPVEVDSDSPEPVAPLPHSSKPVNASQRKRFWFLVFGRSIVAVLLVSALMAWYFHGARRWPFSKTDNPPTVRSIAVMPLLNLSSDPAQQFFADGIADELITNLAQIGSLRVISHTSAMAYSGTHKSAPEIARELGVDALVEGSVARSGNRVRITAELIYAASDRHLWAHTFDQELSDVLTVQGEVAREIAASISQTLTPQEQARLSQPHPMSPEVALLYFKGSYLLSRLENDQAIDVFTQATRMDPGSAEAWAGLADALHTSGVFDHYEAFGAAKKAANKALEIDPAQARALMVLGAVSFVYDWKPVESEAYFRRSIASRPSYAMAHALFATTLAHDGKFEEAIHEIQVATTLDPVSVLTNSQAWHVYFSARRYDEALRIIQATNALDPSFRPAYSRMVISWEQKGEYQKAIEASLRGDLAAGEAPAEANRKAAEFRDALASGGARGYWQHKLDLYPPSDRYGHRVAKCYMHLGKPEDALQALEKGYENREDPFLIFWLPTLEEFDPLRSNPRFQKMLQGFGIQ